MHMYIHTQTKPTDPLSGTAVIFWTEGGKRSEAAQ